MATNEEMRLSRWLAIGSPSVVVLGVLCETVIHLAFRVSLGKALTPTIVLITIQMAFYMSLYSARQRSDGSRDLRLATGVFGICIVSTGLFGMRWAESLGIARSGIFDSNYRLFSVSVLTSTLIAVVLVGLLRKQCE